jgi:hypothetical protein
MKASLAIDPQTSRPEAGLVKFLQLVAKILPTGRNPQTFEVLQAQKFPKHKRVLRHDHLDSSSLLWIIHSSSEALDERPNTPLFPWDPAALKRLLPKVNRGE